jgi:hypothetical protein
VSSLKPIYADNNPKARICYVMNGMWRVQLFSGEISLRNHTNATGPYRSSRKKEHRAIDPWENWSPPLERQEALETLARYHLPAQRTRAADAAE